MTVSNAPMLTPPVVMIASARTAWPSMVSMSLARVVGHATDPEGVAPTARTAAVSISEFESTTSRSRARARLDQLVAGGQHDHPRSRHDAHAGQPGGGEQGDLAGAEKGAGAEDDVSPPARPRPRGARAGRLGEVRRLTWTTRRRSARWARRRLLPAASGRRS